MDNGNSIKIFSWKTAIILCFGVGLLTAGLSVFVQTQNYTAQGFLIEDPKIVTPLTIQATLKNLVFDSVKDSNSATAYTPINTGSSFEAPSHPVRLLIPIIGVDTTVQSVGMAKNGNMGIPTNFTDVAWYNQGPYPGMPGSAVIDGHLDGKKVPKAVFYDLDKLKPGDLVEVVDNNGTTLHFKVTKSQIYDYKAITDDIFSGDSSNAHLNLITCSGSWIKNQKLYDKRIVVFTDLVTD
jgi:LPXTG-site transpeptidase (sortase) family protein